MFMQNHGHISPRTGMFPRPTALHILANNRPVPYFLFKAMDGQVSPMAIVDHGRHHAEWALRKQPKY